MANHLSLEKRSLIVQLLCEGNSLRATSRIADVAFNTVLKMVPEIGKACMAFHNDKVVNVKSKRIQCDETWAFVYAKKKNVPESMEGIAGDAWTWVALDADTKLAVSWFVGSRDADSADFFMHDVASRLANAVQLTTDGLKVYLQAVENAFEGKIDYAQLIKVYGPGPGEGGPERKYSPAECIGIEIKQVAGNPNPIYTSTSYIERQNLTMRMQMRRFTRLTNAFSKKMENHAYAVALYFVYYNWVRIHKTLRVTPAMEAGLTSRLMDFSDIVKLTEIYREDSK